MIPCEGAFAHAPRDPAILFFPAVAAMGLSRSSANRMIKSGAATIFKVGARVMIRQSAFDDMVARFEKRA